MRRVGGGGADVLERLTATRGGGRLVCLLPWTPFPGSGFRSGKIRGFFFCLKISPRVENGAKLAPKDQLRENTTKTNPGDHLVLLNLLKGEYQCTGRAPGIVFLPFSTRACFGPPSPNNLDNLLAVSKNLAHPLHPVYDDGKGGGWKWW